MPLFFLSGCYSIPWVGLLLAPQTTSRSLSLNCSSFEACADYTNCYSFLLQTSADSVSLLPHCSKILSLGPLPPCQILVAVILVDLIIQMDILFQYPASQSLGFLFSKDHLFPLLPQPPTPMSHHFKYQHSRHHLSLRCVGSEPTLHYFQFCPTSQALTILQSLPDLQSIVHAILLVSSISCVNPFLL